MPRPFLLTVPVLMLLAACNSPGDGTTQSETETVPSDDGTVAAPADTSEPTANPMTDGTATTGAPGAASTGMPAQGTTGTPPVNDGTPTTGTAPTDAAGASTTDKTGTPPPANQP